MDDFYRKVLDAAGYYHEAPTAENVRSCFADYLAAGYWKDQSGIALGLDDLEQFSFDEMCVALLRG